LETSGISSKWRILIWVEDDDAVEGDDGDIGLVLDIVVDDLLVIKLDVDVDDEDNVSCLYDAADNIDEDDKKESFGNIDSEWWVDDDIDASVLCGTVLFFIVALVLDADDKKVVVGNSFNLVIEDGKVGEINSSLELSLS